MRTTLNIDDDVLTAVNEIAITEHKSTGKVLSELLRKIMQEESMLPVGSRSTPRKLRGALKGNIHYEGDIVSLLENEWEAAQ